MSRPMKDSGVEWIGEIPKDWNLVRLRYLCNIKTGNKDTINRIDDGEYPFYVRSPKIERIDSYSFDGEAILTAGDGAGVGKVFHYVNEKFDYHQRVYNVHNFKNVLGKFLFHYMRTNFIKEIEKGTAKSTVESVRLPMLLNFPICLPMLDKQQKIAEFLDEKTTQIDSIISDTTQSIVEFKKYKQALITEIVTKGLNPDVKMKDSGIEWIGEIPEHWKVNKLKMAGSFFSAGVDKKIRENENLYRSVHYTDVYYNSLKQIKNNEDYLVISATEDKAHKSNLLKGDVLFTTSSETPEDIGHSTVVEEDLSNTLMGYHLIRFRSDNGMVLSYKKYAFGSSHLRNWFAYRANGMTRYGLKVVDFLDAPYIITPQEEQQHIADFLDEKCAHIDSLIADKEKLIGEFEDYKKALIYEYVTGKKEVE